VWGERVGCYGGSFVGRCTLCVGNVCGVRGWVVMGVNLLEGVYCV
jgi:hypothetical protein